MSELNFETSQETRLYPGAIAETVDRALGFQALISLEELGE